MGKNILLCGVGGQGTILAGNILASSAMSAQMDVKKSEIHGMSQRGGSVVSHVRFGQKIYSPIIRKGECDIILSFEELEALRWADYLKKDGIIITNSQHILPMSVSAGKNKYPEDIQSSLADSGIQSISFDALGEAERLGNKKCQNIILIGMLAKKLPLIEKQIWINEIKNHLPEKLWEINTQAFETGFNSI